MSLLVFQKVSFWLFEPFFTINSFNFQRIICYCKRNPCNGPKIYGAPHSNSQLDLKQRIKTVVNFVFAIKESALIEHTSSWTASLEIRMIQPLKWTAIY